MSIQLVMKKKTGNKSYSWGNSQPYNSYREYIHRKFGTRVQKISVDAGFSCPNRDGSKGYGGCIYCNNDSFTPNYLKELNSIPQQIKEGQDYLRKRYKAEKFNVYFQAYSNTYAQLDDLKKKYETALSQPDVIGLTIGTRPDCIDTDKLNYLEQLARDYYISIEYGLESPYNETLNHINRLHTVEEFSEAVWNTVNRGINIGTHIILGLPNETRDQMINGAHLLSSFPIDYMKLHHLHIVEGTTLATRYQTEKFLTLGCMEYVELAGEYLRRIRPDIVIQRLAGETHPRNLIAPVWGIRANRITQLIEEYLVSNNTCQGDLAEIKFKSELFSKKVDTIF